MALEQRIRRPEFGQHLVLGHRLSSLSYPGRSIGIAATARNAAAKKHG
jgi:hypothetical protein